MKKIIFSAIFACLLVFNTQAQDEPKSEDEPTVNLEYSKWQARLKLVSVTPRPYNSINGAKVEWTTAYVPELNFQYFFTRSLSAEMLLVTSTHDIEIKDVIDLGQVSLIPINFSFKYHFYLGDFKPYLATGMHYTIFYGADAGDLDSIEYKNEMGNTIQIGVDYSINDKWFINLDLKKMFLKTEITANNDASSMVEANIDPLLAGIGIGMKF